MSKCANKAIFHQRAGGGSEVGSPVVLIVEDQFEVAGFLSEMLEGKGVRVLWAFNIQEAERLFRANGHFDAIAMDCCVPGRTPNTMELVKMMREAGYKGPIIANSSREEFLDLLLKAGADHSCDKFSLRRKLFEILGL